MTTQYKAGEQHMIELGGYALEVELMQDTDFDDAFLALDLETNETIRVNGWLIEHHERLTVAAF